MPCKEPCHCYSKKDKGVALIKSFDKRATFFFSLDFYSAIKSVVTGLTKLTLKWLNWKLVFPFFLLRANGTWRNVLVVLSALLHLLQLIFCLCLAFCHLSSHCYSGTLLCVSPFTPPRYPFILVFDFFSPLHTNVQPAGNCTHSIPHPLCLMMAHLQWRGAPSPSIPAFIWSLIGWGSCQVWCMIGCLRLPREMALVLWERDLITGTYERADEGTQKEEGRKNSKVPAEYRKSEWKQKMDKENGKTCMMKRQCIYKMRIKRQQHGTGGGK